MNQVHCSGAAQPYFSKFEHMNRTLMDMTFQSRQEFKQLLARIHPVLDIAFTASGTSADFTLPPGLTAQITPTGPGKATLALTAGWAMVVFLGAIQKRF